MAFKPSQRRSREEEDTELNITPIMNLMVVLIPLLLSVAQLTEIALLEYLPPAEAAEAPDAGSAPEEPGQKGGEEARLSLVINLTESNIQVSMFNKVKPGPHFYEIPLLPEGTYDWKALNDSLWSVKQREVGPQLGLDSTENEFGEWEYFPRFKFLDGRELSITARGETPFQLIVAAMDVCRFHKEDGEKRELFPVTVLKQFE